MGDGGRERPCGFAVRWLCRFGNSFSRTRRMGPCLPQTVWGAPVQLHVNWRCDAASGSSRRQKSKQRTLSVLNWFERG